MIPYQLITENHITNEHALLSQTAKKVQMVKTSKHLGIFV